MPSLGDLLRRLSALSSLSGTASAIGIAIAVAYFMYFVCCALDRNPDLHPVAKSDIARFLKTAQFREEIVLVSRHIGKLFNLLFGHSHFTLRCIKTSLDCDGVVLCYFWCSIFRNVFFRLTGIPKINRARHLCPSVDSHSNNARSMGCISIHYNNICHWRLYFSRQRPLYHISVSILFNVYVTNSMVIAGRNAFLRHRCFGRHQRSTCCWLYGISRLSKRSLVCYNRWQIYSRLRRIVFCDS